MSPKYGKYRESEIKLCRLVAFSNFAVATTDFWTDA